MTLYNRSGWDYFSYGGTLITWMHDYHQTPVVELDVLCRVHQKGTQYYGKETYISNTYSSMLWEQFLSQEENTLQGKKNHTYLNWKKKKKKKKKNFGGILFVCDLLALADNSVFQWTLILVSCAFFNEVFESKTGNAHKKCFSLSIWVTFWESKIEL